MSLQVGSRLLGSVLGLGVQGFGSGRGVCSSGQQTSKPLRTIPFYSLVLYNTLLYHTVLYYTTLLYAIITILHYTN